LRSFLRSFRIAFAIFHIRKNPLTQPTQPQHIFVVVFFFAAATAAYLRFKRQPRANGHPELVEGCQTHKRTARATCAFGSVNGLSTQPGYVDACLFTYRKSFDFYFGVCNQG
ncbi:MAG TPA: hypothetical protein VIJ57_16555, partial [Hanamia sp.]